MNPPGGSVAQVTVHPPSASDAGTALDSFLSRQMAFVAGKGVAAALALDVAERRRRGPRAPAWAPAVTVDRVGAT